MPPVLIVDADTDTRHILRLILAESGYASVEAQDAQTGLEALARLPARGIVLFDAHLLHQDGARMLHAIAADPNLRSRYAFLCLSTSPERLPAELRDLLAGLCIPVLTKPFSIDDIVAHVAHVHTYLRTGQEDVPPARTSDSLVDAS